MNARSKDEEQRPSGKGHTLGGYSGQGVEAVGEDKVVGAVLLVGDFALCVASSGTAHSENGLG